MKISEDQDRLERERAELIATEVPLFEGVERISVELGEDQTGDPAMWLVFHLRSGFDANREWIRRFLVYKQGIQLKILNSGLQRFPYTRFGEAA